MKTPSFETHLDQKREERIAGFLESEWDVSCHKLPISYGLDYWIESKEKCYWCEVKCRSIPYAKYDTLILSANKLTKGSMHSIATGYPFIIVFGMTDGVYMHTWRSEQRYEIMMNISQDPTYAEDNEPYVHIPKSQIEILRETPLGYLSSDIGYS
jgi:hypothetical protein